LAAGIVFGGELVKRLVFLLEEPSMKLFLEGLMPRVFPLVHFLCIPHQGKQDLEKSIPRKLRAWTDKNDAFIILRDNDGGDCSSIKSHLLSLCHGITNRILLIRLACQELEAWYLGDPEGLAEGFRDPGLRMIEGKAHLRDPDRVSQPSRVIKTLVPSFQKLSGARTMGKCIMYGRNRSRSFAVLIEGVENLSGHNPVG
jgi:hypothetical protein